MKDNKLNKRKDIFHAKKTASDESEKEETTPGNRKPMTQKEAISLYRRKMIIGILVGTAILYLLFSVYYAFHFLGKTYVNGVDVSGRSVASAGMVMTQRAPGYSLTVKGPGDARAMIDGRSLQVSVTDASGLRDVMRKQNGLNWIFGSFKKKSYAASVQTSYDEDALENAIDGLQFLDESTMIDPADAVLEETDDGSYKITPEVVGTKLDVDKCKEAIRDAVDSYQQEVDLTEYQDLPEVYSDNKNLVRRRDEWNAFLRSAGLTFTFPTKTVKLTGKKIASLLSDDGAEVTISYDLVADLMARWKDKYDTYANKFDFKTTNGDMVQIMPWGDYGYELNEEGTAKDLIQYIKDGDTGTHEPEWYHEGQSLDNYGLGDTYCEVSITDQYLWVYKDGKCVVDTDVVTGNPEKDEKGKNRETYKGLYCIKGKYEDQTLGTLDVQGYASPVSYWVPFNGGEGFHDAPWRDVFGGNIYKTNGSHGCVNCPEWIMGDIYKNVSVDEPVIIY
ncbi:MAG: L,D-transpeptidase family protein [Lachnospiraceae bacterium]|nr:L,D-transpeptidase family protein [Lachnospiraceae bacterium]